MVVPWLETVPWSVERLPCRLVILLPWLLVVLCRPCTSVCRVLMEAPCWLVTVWSAPTALSTVPTRPDTLDSVLLRSLICCPCWPSSVVLAATSASMVAQRCCNAAMAAALAWVVAVRAVTDCWSWVSCAETDDNFP